MNAPDARLFRRAAIEHYVGAGEIRGVVNLSPPWVWALFGTAGAAVVLALAVAVAARVEVTGRARGIVRPISGVRVLTTQVGGTVADIAVRSGESVAAGRPVVALESAPLTRERLEAERQVQLLESGHRVFSARQDVSATEQAALLRARLAMLDDQVRSQSESVRLFERKLQANVELGKLGLVSGMALEDGREALAQSQRQLSATKQAVAQARQELASLSARRQEDLWLRERDLESARSRKDALDVTLGQLVVRAPAAGFVEAVLVKPGDVVEAGQIVGKLVPGEKRFHVVSFLPEKDRPFVHADDAVRLEVDPLPVAQFGTMKGTVVRIGADLASAPELRDALGDDVRADGPTYRVEIRIDDGSLPRFAPVLRSGMLTTVRYTLRRPRLLALVFEPLRRWLE
jgi:membrane fusion protein